MKLTYLLAATVMIAASGGADAQTLVGPADGITGIDGLAVDGKTYDVTFNSGTLAAAFPAGINFNSINSANDAATSLATALQDFSVTGIGFSGCPEFLAACQSVFIPFSVDASGDTNSLVTTGYWCCNPHSVVIGWGGAEAPVRSSASGPASGPAFGFSYWGVFTQVATSVPEPAAFGLLILGLASVGVARPRKTI